MKLSDIKIPDIELSVKHLLIIFLTVVIPMFVQNCNHGYKIEQAELHAKTAIELNELQAKQIERIRVQSTDMLNILLDMAEKRKITKEQINTLNDEYNVKADSSQREIIHRKRKLNDLWLDVLRKSEKE